MKQTPPQDIIAFFDDYRAAFNRLDDKAIARFYAVPSGIQHGRDYTIWTAFEPITDNMAKLCKVYADSCAPPMKRSGISWHRHSA